MVDIYHRICIVDWCLFWGARPFQYAWWISTTVFAQWTGAYFGLQDLSNMRGRYLPPYLHSGLVFIFIHNPHDSQSNMRGGYLPLYLHSGLVHILGCKTFPL